MLIDNEPKNVLLQSVDPWFFLSEYNDVLLGKRKTFSSSIMAKGQGAYLCAELLRLIFKEYFHWTPEEVRDKLTPEIVRKMKLSPLIRRIPCPPELNPAKEVYYVAWYLYPWTKTTTTPELIVKLYNDVMTGAIKRFPSSYFDGNEGYIRARILFLTMVKEYLPPFKSLENMYAFFASPRGRRCINDHKLIIPLRELYGTPLAYLHDSLSPAQKSEELYKKYAVGDMNRGDAANFLPVTEEEMDALYGEDIRHVAEIDTDEDIAEVLV